MKPFYFPANLDFKNAKTKFHNTNPAEHQNYNLWFITHADSSDQGSSTAVVNMFVFNTIRLLLARISAVEY